MVLISAYSGMRREEIGALRVDDVHDDDAFAVTEGKTRAAVRRVPIHPVIKSLVARLKRDSKDGFLIPGLLTGGPDNRRSHYVGKRFTPLRRKLGFEDGALNFHTLRNAFMQRCEDKEVPESTTKLLVGHSRKKQITYGTYSPGPNFEVLRKAAAKVTFGEVDALAKAIGSKVAVTKTSKRRRTGGNIR
jgi:integrase